MSLQQPIDSAPAGAPAHSPSGMGTAFMAASALLAYPQQDLLDALGQIQGALEPGQRATLAPLFAHLDSGDIIDLQEHYVSVFDRGRAHSLHLFEHIHGDSRDRGQALIDLRQEYLDHGLLPDTSELPDYIPLFWEFLGQIPPDQARQLLDETVHVLARIEAKLTQAQSPYAAVFTMIRALGTVAPEPLPELEPEDEEEKPITFGPDDDGHNPADTLARLDDGAQPVTFYARDGKPRRLAGGGDARPRR
jgi:nitrate reductase delta subunit